MRSFLAVGLAALVGVAGCAARGPKGPGATSIDCSAVREAAQGEAGPEQIFAWAECEHRRVAQAKGRGWEEVGKLYERVGASDAARWQIAALSRTGDLLVLAGRRHYAAARSAYSESLAAASAASVDVRLQVEVLAWIKGACRGLRQIGGGASRYKACKQWSGAWRGQ